MNRTGMLRAGIARILDACHSLEPQSAPRDDAEWVGFELGLRLWTLDMQRVLTRAVTLLDDAARLGLEGGVEPLEECFGRIDQASEKLRSILVQALGIDAFVMDKRLKFRPHAKEPRRRLIALLRSIPPERAPARQLLDTARDLHDVRTVRDDLAHGLAFITNTYVAGYRVVLLNESLEVIERRSEYLPPPFAFIMPDIRDKTRFATGLAVASAGLDTLLDSLELTAEVIESEGRYTPPPEAYVRVLDGRFVYSLTDPRKAE